VSEDRDADARAYLARVRAAQVQVGLAVLACIRSDRLAIERHLVNTQRELLAVELGLREGGA
jgi:hypothetical protein